MYSQLSAARNTALFKPHQCVDEMSADTHWVEFDSSTGVSTPVSERDQVSPYLCGGRVEKPNSVHLTDLPVIRSLVYCESSTLDHAATKEGWME
uniref:Uncharacterized protein n=1 Tax=Timema poppense TaxID=170557 RepID=A0A7R9DCK1_TIMPO|nr:unnamed protein product [Timema poppensis]